MTFFVGSFWKLPCIIGDNSKLGSKQGYWLHAFPADVHNYFSIGLQISACSSTNSHFTTSKLSSDMCPRRFHYAVISRWLNFTLMRGGLANCTQVQRMRSSRKYEKHWTFAGDMSWHIQTVKFFMCTEHYLSSRKVLENARRLINKNTGIFCIFFPEYFTQINQYDDWFGVVSKYTWNKLRQYIEK